MSNEPNRPLVRKVIGVGLVIAAVALGWYLGSRVGDDGPPPDRAGQEAESGIHRDVAGQVVRLAPEDGVFTVDHERIEGFMPAMVMDLQVANPGELDNLSPGDAILFDLVQIGEVFQAVRIRRVNDEAGDADASRSDAASSAAEPALGRGDLVPDLVLFDVRGERFRLRGMEPRHKVITFFYVRCPLMDFCPAQSQRLAQLQSQLHEADSAVHLLSLTLDAEHDQPPVLAGYADRFGVDPSRWTLAGADDAEAIRTFADRAGARIYADDQGFEIDHALVALRVAGDRIVDRVYGLDAIEQLVRGVR